MGKVQLDFDSFLTAYANADSGLDNEAIYRYAAREAGISEDELNRLEPIGSDGRKYSKIKREIRWHQQTLKRAGWLEKTDVRGKWTLSSAGRKKVELRKAVSGFSMLAFSTKLGVAIFGDSRCVFSKIDTDIDLVLTSPPYTLRSGLRYLGGR